MSSQVTVTALPFCDLCSDGKTLAQYDAATKMGSWAYLCEAHFRDYGVGLGTGAGQRLVVEGQQ
jgi:hypothetical protein